MLAKYLNSYEFIRNNYPVNDMAISYIRSLNMSTKMAFV